jgi:hypothetical protein
MSTLGYLRGIGSCFLVNPKMLQILRYLTSTDKGFFMLDTLDDCIVGKINLDNGTDR